MMSKRLVLVYPKYVSGWQVQTRLATPLGLVCVGTPASLAGYDVKIIDQRIDPDWRATLIKELEQDPICVGVSSMTGPQIQFALEISRVARRYGNAPIVWGGVHPSLLPEQTLENENIDIVVQGEGEETFLELVQALEGKRPLSSVRGIWYKEDGGVRSTDARPFVDLNRMPPLSFDLIDLDKYRRIMFGVPHQNFFTSRGCPCQCTFCYNTAFNRRRWRAMDPDLVVERIKAFVGKHHIKGLIINESNFFVDVDRGRRILKGIIDANLDIVISKVNIDMNTLFRMGPDDFDLLHRAGCRRLPIAIESGSEKIRTLIKKPADVDHVLQTNRDLVRTPIVPNFLFMIGFPTETREDLAESVSLAFKLVEENPRAGIYFNNYTPYPGTELFATAVEHGLQVPKRVEDWVAFNYRNLIQDGPWLSKEMRRIVKMMDFCSFFIGQRPLLKPTEETSMVATLLGRVYAPLARKRAKRLDYRFPLEIRLAKLLRIYGKQD
jgi:anaerobic magnesium-protoporphyrin IX monomethyl ester cyclase